MNTNVLTLTRPGLSRLAKAQDFVELTKPRISFLVSVTVATAVCLAMEAPDGRLLFHVALATAAVAASASVFNQLIERHTDRKMVRTARRPIPAGRLSSTEAATFGVGLLVVGTCYLWAAANWQTAAWGLLTWLLYVGLYTPLKRVTVWNTLVGAFPGAMPVFIGWSATGQPLDERAWSLFALLFFWQFPHFMAIAWRLRHQYREANLKMITVTDPSGWSAGWVSVFSALVLIPLSVTPWMTSAAAGLVAAGIACLGLWQLAWCVQFLQQRDDQTARRLLYVSLVYLPVVLIGLVVASFV